MAGPGVEPEEGPYPDHGIKTRFRWLLGPTCQVILRASVTGRHLIALRLQNRLFEKQNLRLLLDDDLVLEVDLPNRRDEDFELLSIEVPLTQGRHRLNFEFANTFTEAAPRRRNLALRFDSLVIKAELIKTEAQPRTSVSEKWTSVRRELRENV